ncbi:class I SAM-dependent methyltransferase [Hoeflea sp. TYP-13]|uniref:class I SAM-dependent methyltransferase n=1 Tax=Hoeflea sp. TYP-13 TaxID=3230023 RepID=UPI0034C5DC92
MDTETLGRSRLMNLLAKPGGVSMDSRLRRWFMNPKRTLLASGIKPGQTVLEVGCGPGFFTLDAAELIGEQGRLIAMDPLSDYVKTLKSKVRQAGLKNVEVLQRDALNTGLDANSVDLVLLFGVLPFPTLPLSHLLPEMHRVLKPGGSMSVWLFPTAAVVPSAIIRSGLFQLTGRQNRVFNYRPVSTAIRQ